jgi:hypothetical protein
MPRKPTPLAAPAPSIRGTRSDYVKVAATLSPEAYRLLIEELSRRKLAREVDAQASAIIRDAMIGWFGKGGGGRREK